MLLQKIMVALLIMGKNRLKASMKVSMAAPVQGQASEMFVLARDKNIKESSFILTHISLPFFDPVFM